MTCRAKLATHQDTKHYPVIEYLRTYRQAEDGVLMVPTLLIFLLMLMVGGIGVDLMRYERDRSRVQASLDNAVLAASSLNQTRDPEVVVRDYLHIDGVLSYLTGVTVDEDAYHREVSATAAGSVYTQYMGMSGATTLPMNVDATAIESEPDTEISLVLDISGSMRLNSRVETMQTAAKEFVSASLSRNSDPETGTENPFQTSVNVIPFAGQTNPGETMFEYLDGERFGTTTSEDYFPEWGQDISNIVFWFDTNGDGEIDYSVKIEGYPDADVEMFNKDDLDTYYLYAQDYIAGLNPDLEGNLAMLGATIKGGKEETSYYSIVGDELFEGPTKYSNVDMEIQFSDFYTGLVPNNVASCLEMTYEDFLSTGLPGGTIDQVPYFVNWDYDEVTQNWGWCPDDSMSIQYAQDDVDSLHSFIDNLRLYDGTGTNYGMKYALALLDPATQPAFEHLSTTGEVPERFSNRPLQWDATDSSKFIVLMTDGRTSAQVRPSDALTEENTTTELTARPTSDTTVESGQSSNLSMFLQQCQLAKNNGVIVYTVAVDIAEYAIEEIRECASSDGHFFEVQTEELTDAFVAIASSIQHLRLVQ
ncbi:hypothetical protein DL239_13410 [Sedimentitalea sp. CY04]|uniref:Putative Flp pilus-assembly TadG-like N-terminal domain-containing protein n=1 Tax=Parasedimentitalea denitrificans TaxID=2211118 RepID=A0ABX0W8I8_9RHOB|nr:TadE/TadG family type IV pilus assembly protein [Sedimentitalea sp. CY04]NIZ61973.1 hypothetical protein [Sedimentitalea sp. CY04]